MQIQTPEQVRLRLHLAGIGSRAVAQLIDLLVLVVFYVLFTLSELMWQWLNVFGSATSYLVGAAVVISFLIFWGYFIALETALSGQTIGKKIMKIRAVGRDGRPLSFYASTVRNLLRVVDFLPFGYLIGMVVTVIDKQERRLGDLAAGTVVVHDRMMSFWELGQGNVAETLDSNQSASVDSNLSKPGIATQPLANVQITVPKCTAAVLIQGTLPGDWGQFLSEFTVRLRSLSKEKRNELVPEVWRRFTALDVVTVEPWEGNVDSRRKSDKDKEPMPFVQAGSTTTLQQTSAKASPVQVTLREMEHLLTAVSRQIRDNRRGRKS